MMSSGDSSALRNWDRMTFTWALKDMQMMERPADSENMTFPLAGLIKELVKDGRKIMTNPPDWSGEGRHHRMVRRGLVEGVLSAKTLTSKHLGFMIRTSF